MLRSSPLRSIVGLVLALGFLTASVAVPTTAGAANALPAWHGGVDLYRAGAFTTQKSWLWCTAAGVQIVRNIVRHQSDHSTAGQRAYFAWMRRHNRYDLPLSAGVDPGGWTAGLRHFVDDRYRLVASPTFDEALHSAVDRLRRTNLPVAITVSHGNHGWILTGFRATADPAKTASFTVTSVRVVGPLYGLQSKNGYDMPPNTRLTPTQLRRFFTPWKYAPKPMIWDGRYVSIQPVPRKAVVVAASPTRPRPSPTRPRAPASARPSATASPIPTPAVTASPPLPVAILASANPPISDSDAASSRVVATREGVPGATVLAAVLAALTVLALAVIGSRMRRRAPPA